MKYELSQFKADILREKGKEKRKRKSDSVLSTIDKTNHNHNTQKEIAKDLNWSFSISRRT